MNKKILLTGGNGFFSSRFADYYKNTYDILALGRKELDITDDSAVDKYVADFKPDIIIHAGAVAVTDFCENNPDLAYKINVSASVNIGKVAKKYGAKLVFLSSEQVFNGNSNSGAFTEDDTPVPNTVYGKNKLEAENLLQDILDELWIVRFTWLFGLPERNKQMSNGILWETMSKLINQENIVASKREFRGMTYVYDVIENFPKLFHIPYGIYHFGSENDYSRYDVVNCILQEFGLDSNKINSVLEEDLVKYKDSNRDVRLNSSKVASFGIEFSNTLDSLKKCMKEYYIC